MPNGCASPMKVCGESHHPHAEHHKGSQICSIQRQGAAARAHYNIPEAAGY